MRYLEQGEFKLVRESLKERAALLKIAPHIVWPLEFILPLDTHVRPAWMIRLGLFLYEFKEFVRGLGEVVAAGAEDPP